ncbi:MAG: prephenate dehydrogenase/arogenate dehydrogenase family protein [Deltaproteobacteria bacterium]|nr:prephenate dehydrogenase/arogenate dehydrogenase family protein [Deltaproteobacteria bacterium]
MDCSDDIRFDRVYLLGTGLIGGSLALDLHANGLAGTIVGSDDDPESLQMALDMGILDGHLPPTRENFRTCDLVILAIPVLNLVEILADGFDAGTLVTDVGSVKYPLVEAYLESIKHGADYDFVPGHPIAGDERSGPDSARRGLFRGARAIITPVAENDPNIAPVAAMWRGVGARVEIMDPEYHDSVFAWVSHLPHMVAYGIVDAVLEKDRSWVSLSGGGLRDYTRVAASSPRMWADIAVANKSLLLEALGGFRASIDKIYTAVESGDHDRLEETFRRIASVRREMK